MENYVNDGAAVLSKDNIASIDEMIVTAVARLPASAVVDIMPITKTAGPSIYWIEPWYQENKIKLISTTLAMDDNASQRRLSFTAHAAENLRHVYTPESFTKTVQNWVMWYKFERQRKQLIDILTGPVISLLTPITLGINLADNATQDETNAVESAIMQAITSLRRRFKLGDMDFSVVGPYEISWAVLQLQAKIPGKIHYMGDDTIDKVYVFPTGSGNMSRAGFGLFEYADTIQSAYDSDTGEEVYFYYNRSVVALNPVHTAEPIVEVISLA